ncbi:hypothetical protein FHS39_000572 [Streptomyces olivoverticillatus]|uniref:Uncharacterized protein n=1 Tax=Streptomyces olivoverticillatus TaxID=66427 RepID=A0A7W7PIZ0_9ACTN|nr:hypothetical protein [Streptomyces olivoverticillatus]MBB4891572.1 hypothetical protein [Streptomyces olivoverticillatus]
MRGGLVGVAMWAVLVGAAGPAGAEGPVAYRMAPDAKEVRGSGSSTAGPELAPGTGTYTDTLRPGEKRYYTVELDDRSNAYVSAVAVPRPGSTMGMRDGIELSLQTRDGVSCGTAHHRSFLSVGGAYPVADYAERIAGAAGPCKAAGTYRFAVERGEATGGDLSPVPVELKYVTEQPGSAGGTSRPPSVARADGEGVTGGTGFNDAAEVGEGVWKDELRPGETRFYKVAVDSGEQLFADAEFAAAAGTRYVVGGVRLGLSNAARGYVMNKTGGYQGKPSTVSLATPPAAYGSATGEAVRGMRMAGWYYLQVSVSAKVRDPAVPVRLRVDVAGAGTAERGALGGTDHGGTGGESVASAGGSRGDERLRIVGYAGVGTGSALLVGLGAWTLVARRRGD